MTAIVSGTPIAQTPPPVEITTTELLTEPVLPELVSTAPTTTATIRNTNVNIRSGPGMDYPVVTVAAGGDKFDVVGKSEDGAWWNICCVAKPGDEGSATQQAWVATSVVQVEGDPDQVRVIGPLFPPDLSVEWLVDYQCDSERCQVNTCTAQMSAKVRSTLRGRWLEIDRVLKWQSGCAKDSSVLGQIDRYTGQERYAVDGEAFIYRFWAGDRPGPANTVFTLSDGRQVNAWCQDSLQAEVDEGGGWTTIYDGSTCYDLNSGILLNMSYTKRWLFSGTFEGQTYERAFWGDSESYDITLDTTNFAGLSLRVTQ
ncbi:MAG: SH3 domain-containing protein [Caldilineaceae bacterium]|nr:SH3 domain-containing protein [Caldilineaceae bacterium]MBP8108555.1 SH3 domain-containing protein [Caldilineaceae bacterium]MBP8121864.1 SH3 domain-containing protein [Caldilineaceae bacterium]MBP9073639.1 SH3 domain-containing protein [Caldilineaceae bacterium]